MYYRLSSAANVIPLAGGGLLLKTDTVSLRVEGGFADLLQRSILPALDGTLSLLEVAQRLELPAESLKKNFEELVESGLFEQRREAFPTTQPDPRFNLLRALGFAEDVLHQRFSEARIAVFGLERPGALVAEALLEARFRNLVLIDPTAAQSLDFLPSEAVEQTSREDLVSNRLKQRYPNACIDVSRRTKITREVTLELARGLDLLVACWDQGFSSGNHWINRAAHATRVPALFCELRGMQFFAGPFVIPGMTACFMCARMRAIAVADEYEEAMAYECFLDQLKSPEHARRQVLEPALSTLASLLATEAVKFVVLNQQPVLLGGVVEYDPFELSPRRHALLEHPACPVCSEKKTTPA